MTVKLDGSLMTDRNELHDYLKLQLELPEYYGKNLDALYDILTERLTPVKIEFSSFNEAEISLGNYARSLADTLRDAAEENPFLEIEFI